MFNDFKYALRLLCKAPVFTALTIVVMTCGLSFSIYTASLINTLIFKDLPFPASENIVVIDKMQHGTRLQGGKVLASDLLVISEKNSTLNELLFYQPFFVNMALQSSSQRLHAVAIEPGGFEFTHTKPLLGRTLQSSDLDKERLSNAVISYKLWDEYFARDALVIGKTLRVDNQIITVIGVMPEGYRFPHYADIWFAYDRDVIERGKFDYIAAIAKLKPNVSIQVANKDIAAIMFGLSDFHYESNGGVSAYVETFQKQALGRQSMAAIYALIAITLFVLLLSCVNVGSLLLSKALERAHETALRRALGAPRFRVIMQMLWESAIICIISGFLALSIVAWALQFTNSLLVQNNDSQSLYWWVFSIENNTVIATVIVVIFTIFVAGFLPCWKATGGEFNQILQQGRRGATNLRVSRLSHLLIQIEIGLSVMILVVSAMFVINTLQSNDYLNQFDENNLLTFNIELPDKGYLAWKKYDQTLRSIEAQIEALAGVENIAMSTSIPGNVAWVTEVHRLQGSRVLSQVNANTVSVSYDLFSSFNITPLEGRLFDLSDQPDTQKVAVISDSLAQKLWPNESPIGKRIVLKEIGSAWVEVIGIINHIEHGNAMLAIANEGGIYLANSQHPSALNTVIVQYQGDQAELILKIRKILYQLDSNMPAFNVMPYQQMIDRNLNSAMFGSALFAIFAVIALLLTASGIYGVTVNGINQRLREIGIRRALGVSKGQVFLYFIKNAMEQLLIGLSLGSLLALLICYYLLPVFLINNSLMIVVFIVMFLTIVAIIILAVIISLLRILKQQPAYALRAQ